MRAAADVFVLKTVHQVATHVFTSDLPCLKTRYFGGTSSIILADSARG